MESEERWIIVNTCLTSGTIHIRAIDINTGLYWHLSAREEEDYNRYHVRLYVPKTLKQRKTVDIDNFSGIKAMRSLVERSLGDIGISSTKSVETERALELLEQIETKLAKRHPFLIQE